MIDFLFSGPAAWFSIPAIAATGLFAVRMVFSLWGGELGEGVGADADFGESGDTFQLISLQTITAFAMGYGWGGFGAVRGSGLPFVAGVGVGLVTGIGMVWLRAMVSRFVLRFQSSGMVIDAAQALDCEGTVYTAIPAARAGRGQIRVIIDDHERFFQAVSAGAAIPPRTPVRVVDLENEGTLLVEPLPALPA